MTGHAHMACDCLSQCMSWCAIVRLQTTARQLTSHSPAAKPRLVHTHSTASELLRPYAVAHLLNQFVVGLQHRAWGGVGPLLEQGPRGCGVGCPGLCALQSSAPAASGRVRVCRLQLALASAPAVACGLLRQVMCMLAAAAEMQQCPRTGGTQPSPCSTHRVHGVNLIPLLARGLQAGIPALLELCDALTLGARGRCRDRRLVPEGWRRVCMQTTFKLGADACMQCSMCACRSARSAAEEQSK